MRLGHERDRRHTKLGRVGSGTVWGLFLAWGFLCQLVPHTQLWGPWGEERETPILASYPSAPSWCLKGWGGLPLLCPGSETLGSVSLAPSHPGEQRAWL